MVCIIASKQGVTGSRGTVSHLFCCVALLVTVVLCMQIVLLYLDDHFWSLL
jgi:hypothetical protein